MSDVVIRAEGLGKKYLIGVNADRERYTALRDVIARTAKSVTSSARDLVLGRQARTATTEEFWALKDVSFEVKRGEVVGVIGLNGAGKSTLLKVLSRITEPTAGRVEIKGRVASLLEVGTGFHPELTGRENIFLNGAILGMSRAEIRSKFDEIVDFADVAKFLDTPVKRYSSGMYVRLAFAVAAHLEPEILVVDEVLAVGDAEFQKKCLGKLQTIAGHGRTVLYVSHDLGSLASICETGILLERGRLRAKDAIASVVQAYRTGSRNTAATLSTEAFGGPLKSVNITDVRLNGQVLAGLVSVMSDEEILIELSGHASEAVPDFRFAIALASGGQRILTCHDGPTDLAAGPFRVHVRIPAEVLRPGEYSFATGGRRLPGFDWIWGTDLASIEIVAKWSSSYDRDDKGVINLPGIIERVPQDLPQDGVDTLLAGSPSAKV